MRFPNEQTRKLKEYLDTIPIGYWIAAREGLQERHSGSLDGTEEEPISATDRKLAEAVILWTYLSLTRPL